MQPVRFLFAPSYIGGQLRGQFAAAGGEAELRKRRANQPDPERSVSYLKECCAGAKSKREPPVPGERPERSGGCAKPRRVLANLPTDVEAVYPCCDPDGERLRANLSLPCWSTRVMSADATARRGRIA